MMTYARVVKPSVNVVRNRPSQDYTHPDERTSPTYVVRTEGALYDLAIKGNMHPGGVLPCNRLMGYAAGWGCIFATGLTIMGLHFQ